MDTDQYSHSHYLKLMVLIKKKTGIDKVIEELRLYFSTEFNNLDSTRKAFLNLMLEYTYSEHFEQKVRDLSSNIQLNVVYSVNTSL